MSLQYIIFICLTSCVWLTLAPPVKVHSRVKRIIGGQTATSHPFVVRVRNGEHLCTGSLISRCHVLTAGHCIKPDNGIRIIAGGHRAGTSRNTVTYDWNKAILLDRTQGDVGILRLDRCIEEDAKNIKPIAITEERIEDGRPVRIYGWGQMNQSIMEGAKYLQEVNTYLNTAACDAASSAILRINICTPQVTGFGDSGGPVIVVDKNGGNCQIAITTKKLDTNLVVPVEQYSMHSEISHPAVFNFLNNFIQANPCGCNSTAEFCKPPKTEPTHGTSQQGCPQSTETKENESFQEKREISTERLHTATNEMFSSEPISPPVSTVTMSVGTLEQATTSKTNVISTNYPTSEVVVTSKAFETTVQVDSNKHAAYTDQSEPLSLATSLSSSPESPSSQDIKSTYVSSTIITTPTFKSTHRLLDDDFHEYPIDGYVKKTTLGVTELPSILQRGEVPEVSPTKVQAPTHDTLIQGIGLVINHTTSISNSNVTLLSPVTTMHVTDNLYSLSNVATKAFDSSTLTRYSSLESRIDRTKSSTLGSSTLIQEDMDKQAQVISLTSTSMVSSSISKTIMTTPTFAEEDGSIPKIQTQYKLVTVTDRVQIPEITPLPIIYESTSIQPTPSMEISPHGKLTHPLNSTTPELTSTPIINTTALDQMFSTPTNSKFLQALSVTNTAFTMTNTKKPTTTSRMVKSCGEPPLVPNGKINKVKCSQDKRGERCTAVYSCDSCYKKYGPLRCRNGKWNFGQCRRIGDGCKSDADCRNVCSIREYCVKCVCSACRTKRDCPYMGMREYRCVP
ncbi:unnamed protein product [Owenia fusiformis]|uniref:Peptidase S1 domain-containing protein n=1 Tax=Owenia fusiformis TaxID=6347 RepID=A0A8S4Q6Z5_OWEFU|nr:unnamed protein product [Owenia fusiformis]